MMDASTLPAAPARGPASSGFDLSSLRAFTRVPEHHHDVVIMNGNVMVYDTDRTLLDTIIHGHFYVVESQWPGPGMSWETHDRLNRETKGDRWRIKTERRVIRAVKCERDPGNWYQVQPSGFRDGPLPDWSINYNMVGKVVGIFQPQRRGGGQ